jgi:type II secretory pathway component PulM
MNAIAHAWHGRNPRERRVIGIAIGVAVVVMIVVFAWLPLERSRARLAQELPRLRASIAALERDAEEVKRLRSTAPAPTTSGQPLAALATNSGGLAGSQMQVLDERRVRLAGADVSFASLLEWLRNAQATHGMRVESAKVDALPAPGRVRAELVLVRS